MTVTKGEPESEPPATPGERIHECFSSLANQASHAAGSLWAFLGAMLVILVWLALGPLAGFSETWQLVINTGTTIITFLMVFLIQHAQNRETRALQLKLDELIFALKGASNTLIDLEGGSESKLAQMERRIHALATKAEDVVAKAHAAVADKTAAADDDN